MKKKCTLVLISVLTVACIVFAYLLFFYNPSFNMVYDSDTDSYFNNSYLSYNDGTLAAADYRKTKVTAYDSKNNSTVKLPSNGCLINDNLFYINGNKLCCLDTTTNTRKIIDTDCRSFVCNNEVIAYTKNDSVILKDSDTLENIGDIKFDNQIYYINISDGNLYIAERIFEDKTDEYGYSFKVGKQYIFKKYDLKSCKLLKSKNANYVNGIRYVTVCKDTFYFFAILAPSSEESDGCVFVGRSVRVDSIEEVGAPGIRHVGTFLKSYNVDLVVAAKFQIFCRHIGIFRQISLDILCHAKHLLRLGIAPQATVFSCGVSRVEKQFEIAPAC